MVLSASMLWSLLLSLFLLRDLRFTEEWRDPEEGPGDGVLDLLLDDEEGLLSSTSLLPDRLVPGSIPVMETPAVCRSGASLTSSGNVSVEWKKPSGNSSTSTWFVSSSPMSISTVSETTTGLASLIVTTGTGSLDFMVCKPLTGRDPVLSLIPTLPLRLELVKVLVFTLMTPLDLGGPKVIFGGSGFLDLASSLDRRSDLELTGG